jgi:hypothetical protein
MEGNSLSLSLSCLRPTYRQKIKISRLIEIAAGASLPILSSESMYFHGKAWFYLYPYSFIYCLDNCNIITVTNFLLYKENLFLYVTKPTHEDIYISRRITSCVS